MAIDEATIDKRTFLTGCALQGMEASTKQDYQMDEMGRFAVRQADYCLEELNKPPVTKQELPTTTVTDWARTELKRERAR